MRKRELKNVEWGILIIAVITTAITITICATAAIPTVPSLQPDSPVVL